MKIGVIGAGRIGKVHIRNISLFVPELEIKTVADPFANEQTEAYAAQFMIWFAQARSANLTSLKSARVTPNRRPLLTLKFRAVFSTT